MYSYYYRFFSRCTCVVIGHRQAGQGQVQETAAFPWQCLCESLIHFPSPLIHFLKWVHPFSLQPNHVQSTFSLSLSLCHLRLQLYPLSRQSSAIPPLPSARCFALYDKHSLATERPLQAIHSYSSIVAVQRLSKLMSLATLVRRTHRIAMQKSALQRRPSCGRRSPLLLSKGAGIPSATVKCPAMPRLLKVKGDKVRLPGLRGLYSPGIRRRTILDDNGRGEWRAQL